jgi:hypothetical protein
MADSPDVAAPKGGAKAKVTSDAAPRGGSLLSKLSAFKSKLPGKAKS